MLNDAQHASGELSLQGKLDHIAHERDVLALLRDLARAGLCEGDSVVRRDGGARGRVRVLRAQHPPRAVVACDDGTEHSLEPTLWRPR